MTDRDRRLGGQAAQGDELRAGPLGSRAEHSLALIAEIYRINRDPTGWPNVLRALVKLFDDTTVVVLRSNPFDPENVQAVCPGLDADFHRHVAEKYGGRVRNARYLDRFTRGFLCVGEIYPGVEYADTREYRDWLEPRGIAPVWPIAYTLSSDDRRPVLGMALFRLGEARAFSEEEIARANRIVPHLQRTHDIRHSLREVERSRAAIGQVLDRLSPGVIFVDERSRVVTTNRSADQILALEDGLTLEAGVPRASAWRENVRLREILRGATASTSGPRHRGLMSITRAAGRPPLTIYAAPLLDSSPVPRDRDPVAMVLVTDPSGGRGASLPYALRSLYGLTPAESELVSLLTRGQSLREVAETRGCTLNTVRTQLRKAFRKTGTRRQGDLVKLALTGLPSAADEG